MEDLRLFIFDTETNGLPVDNDFSKVSIIEIAYVVVDGNLNVIKEENFLVDGLFVISEEITNITGITKALTREKGIEFGKIARIMFDDLKKCQFIMAHNLRFDFGATRKELYKIKTYLAQELGNKLQICSLRMYRKLLPKKIIGNHKLQTIFNYYNKDEEFIQTHRALDDVKMLLVCLRKSEFNVIDYISNKRIPFGKFIKYTYKSLRAHSERNFRFQLKSVHKIRNYKPLLKIKLN